MTQVPQKPSLGTSGEHGASATGAPEGHRTPGLTPLVTGGSSLDPSRSARRQHCSPGKAGDQPKATRLEGPGPGTEQSPVSKPSPLLFPLIQAVETFGINRSVWSSGWSENHHSSLPAAPGGRTPRGSRGLAQPVTWTGCHTETGQFSQRQPAPRARPVSLAHDLKLRAEAQALGPSTPRGWPSGAPERVLPAVLGSTCGCA